MPSFQQHLLIAFSKGYRSEHLFLDKVPKLIGTLDSVSVSLLQDEGNIGKKYFSKMGVVCNDVSLKNTSLKKLANGFTHIIVFWDGDDLTQLIFHATLQKLPLKIIPIEITKVRNKDNNEPFDIYIGRGTIWGNPYPIGIGGTGDDREDVIRKYKEYFHTEILRDPEKKKRLLSLKGYKLGCHCKPLACHGDIIAEYLNSDDSAL